MIKVKRVNKHYYQINARPICATFVDKELMQKVNKILYRYTTELEELFENNREHLIKHNWSLAKPNGKQVTFHSFEPVIDTTTLMQPFDTKIVENLYDIGGANIYSDEVKKAVTKDLELLAKEEQRDQLSNRRDNNGR